MNTKISLSESDLAQFIGTSGYYSHFTGMLYTDGVQYLAEQGQCYWLIDAIAPNQPLKIKIYKIPNSGEASMESLPLISDIPIPTLVTSFKRTIQGVNLHEAYLVTISP